MQSILGDKGRLSNDCLDKLRKDVFGVQEASIDEISMLGPQKFYQIDARARSGSNKHHLFMGGYKLRLSGDFLQLPPVKAGSFAGPSEDNPAERAGKAKAKENTPKSKAKASRRKDKPKAEEEVQD